MLAVLLSGPIGGLIALRLTDTPFSVSSGIGFLVARPPGGADPEQS